MFLSKVKLYLVFLSNKLKPILASTAKYMFPSLRGRDKHGSKRSSRSVGFEPTLPEGIWFLVRRLNRSATTAYIFLTSNVKLQFFFNFQSMQTNIRCRITRDTCTALRHQCATKRRHVSDIFVTIQTAWDDVTRRSSWTTRDLEYSVWWI